jgi:branched-subunit amino acid aminotransferase/4-amino-4-deoxychorismate lyase
MEGLLRGWENVVTTFEIVEDSVRFAFSSASQDDASAALPEGIYTTLRTYRGARILRASAHAERLRMAGAPLGEVDVIRAIAGVLRERPYEEARLRLTFAPPRLFVTIGPFAPLLPHLYEEGVAAITLDIHREHPDAKDTRFISTAAQAYKRLPAGIHEGLMVSSDGRILEGLTSNVFFIVRGALRTEEEGALPGVTRSLVLEVASSRLPISKEAVRMAELKGVDECFLTSVSRGILPVVTINGHPIGVGRPGRETKGLMQGFDALVVKEAIPVL